MPDNTEKELTIMDYYKQEGVRDLMPMKTRGLFSKALMAEDKAGKTTPEALALLDQAIELET